MPTASITTTSPPTTGPTEVFIRPHRERPRLWLHAPEWWLALSLRDARELAHAILDELREYQEELEAREAHADVSLPEGPEFPGQGRVTE